MKIIETSCNRKYAVTETRQSDLSHVWFGCEVKLVRGIWQPKKNARRELVRKEASRVIFCDGADLFA